MAYYSDDDEEHPGLSKSLDDLISEDRSKNRRSGRGGRGRGRGRGGRGRGGGGRGRRSRRADLGESWRGALGEVFDSEDESSEEEIAPKPRRNRANNGNITT